VTALESTMRLLSIPLSPYAARVRAQIYEKDLPVSIEAPDPPLRSEGFKAVYPLGQIPVLILEDGRALSESWVLLNFLEDVFPDPSLRPDDAFGRAQAGLLQTFADNHLRPSMLPLVQAMFIKTVPEKPDAVFDDVAAQLKKLDRLLADRAAPALSIGDLALVPTFYFMMSLTQHFGRPDLIDERPRSRTWWDWVQTHRGVARVVEEMTSAQRALAA
jgi:glutathione S-transferase